jgi:hypothetical protein
MYMLDWLSFQGTRKVAGQINVNTAPYEVLCSLGAFNYVKASPSVKDQFARAILAYRYRSKSQSVAKNPNPDPRVPPAPQGGIEFDFTNTAKYPGYGIRSMGELAIPLSSVGTFNLLSQRDHLWGAIYDSCTVRSDTFVVYGYLEAVRANPKYLDPANPFNNSTDWYINNYDAFTGSKNFISDDPNSSGAKLIRVGRRRFVALVDRSDVASSRDVPKVLAIKELPH